MDVLLNTKERHMTNKMLKTKEEQVERISTSGMPGFDPSAFDEEKEPLKKEAKKETVAKRH